MKTIHMVLEHLIGHRDQYQSPPQITPGTHELCLDFKSSNRNEVSFTASRCFDPSHLLLRMAWREPIAVLMLQKNILGEHDLRIYAMLFKGHDKSKGIIERDGLALRGKHSAMSPARDRTLTLPAHREMTAVPDLRP